MWLCWILVHVRPSAYLALGAIGLSCCAGILGGGGGSVFVHDPVLQFQKRMSSSSVPRSCAAFPVACVALLSISVVCRSSLFIPVLLLVICSGCSRTCRWDAS